MIDLRPRTHFLTLDSLRGICACLVALSHFNANSIFWQSPILGRGDIYVDFFFVLSGFVIFANYRDRLRAGYGVGKFMLLRFGRLYPLHFAVLMAFILFDVAQMFLPVEGAALYAPFSAPGEGMDAILANLFLVHSLHVLDTLAFNGPSWSISVEFYCYILFALILAGTGRYYRIVILALALASALTVFQMRGDLYAKLDFGFMRCIYGFACGAFAYEGFSLCRDRVTPLLQKRRFINGTEIIVTLLLLFYIAAFSQGAASMVAPLLFAITILVFSFEGGAISTILRTKALVFIGTLSYSIYMIHIFISGKFFALPIRLLEQRGWDITVQKDGTELVGKTILAGTLIELFYLGTVILCSYISFKIIEEPFRKLARWAVSRIENRQSSRLTQEQPE